MHPTKGITELIESMVRSHKVAHVLEEGRVCLGQRAQGALRTTETPQKRTYRMDYHADKRWRRSRHHGPRTGTIRRRSSRRLFPTLIS